MVPVAILLLEDTQHYKARTGFLREAFIRSLDILYYCDSMVICKLVSRQATKLTLISFVVCFLL